jgi:endonuclease III
MKAEDVRALVESRGQKYSEILGIDISEGKEDEVFKWFLASLLFGAPKTESSVVKTYRCFQKHGVLTPKQILKTGWDDLVKILDEGGYTRYDFKTADRLLEVARNLTEKYSGSLCLIHSESSGAHDFENRLKNLGRGVGNVTVSIFLRELRAVWEKAEPNPTALVVLAAQELGIVKNDATAEEALEQLKAFWARNKIRRKSFVNFETALVRLGKGSRRKKRHSLPLVNSGHSGHRVP